MKASDRCPEQYQGDRCTLAKGHEGNLHKGTFNNFEPDTEPEVEA